MTTDENISNRQTKRLTDHTSNLSPLHLNDLFFKTPSPPSTFWGMSQDLRLLFVKFLISAVSWTRIFEKTHILWIGLRDLSWQDKNGGWRPDKRLSPQPHLQRLILHAVLPWHFHMNKPLTASDLWNTFAWKPAGPSEKFPDLKERRSHSLWKDYTQLNFDPVSVMR